MLEKKFNHSRLKEKSKSTFGKKPFKGKDKNRKGNLKVSDDRIKPKFNGKNKKLLEPCDILYLEYLQTLNADCFVCGKQNGIEWHHVKEFSSDKKNHKRLIPLCGIECHRLGSELSAHGTPVKFREKYPMKLQYEVSDKIYSKYIKGE